MSLVMIGANDNFTDHIDSLEQTSGKGEAYPFTEIGGQ